MNSSPNNDAGQIDENLRFNVSMPTSRNVQFAVHDRPKRIRLFDCSYSDQAISGMSVQDATCAFNKKHGVDLHPQFREALDIIFHHFCNDRHVEGVIERIVFIGCVRWSQRTPRMRNSWSNFVGSAQFEPGLIKRICMFIDVRPAMSMNEFRLWIVASGAGWSSANEMRIKKVFRSFGCEKLLLIN
jgi:hypothetical protein